MADLARRARGIFLGLGTILLPLAGCSREEPLPLTYPVSGSISRENGTPYSGGAIQFRSQKNVDMIVTGRIQEDGSFRLHTIQGKRRAEGAPAGSYRVTVLPSSGNDQKVAFPPFQLPSPVQVEARENTLHLKANPPAGNGQ